MMRSTLVGIVFSLLAACGTILAPPAPSGEPLAVFDEYCRHIERYYPFLDIKEYNWDSAANANRLALKENIHSSAIEFLLCNALQELTAPLHDIHLSVMAPFNDFRGYTITYVDSNTTNCWDFDSVTEKYIKNWRGVPPWGIFGPFNDSIFYWYIGTLSLNDFDEVLDTIISSASDYPHFIIDVRDNQGGYEEIASSIASRFVTKKTLYSYKTMRNGENRADFSKPLPYYFEPTSNIHFDGDVAVIINSGVYSAAEILAHMMRLTDRAIIIGANTVGRVGALNTFQLSNGWICTIPILRMYDPNKKDIEGVGINADIHVVDSRVISADDSHGLFRSFRFFIGHSFVERLYTI